VPLEKFDRDLPILGAVGRADTAWYAAMRIFRQESRGDWGGVVPEIVRALDRDDAP
jgi:hypothetical protein